MLISLCTYNCVRIYNCLYTSLSSTAVLIACYVLGVSNCLHLLSQSGRMLSTFTGNQTRNLTLLPRFRFAGMFQRVSQREGFNSMYGAADQQDIDNFVNFVGEGQSYPPAFTPKPVYQIPAVSLSHHMSDQPLPSKLAQLQNPAPCVQQDDQACNGIAHSQSEPAQQSGTQQQQASTQQTGFASPSRSNIVPFTRKGKASSRPLLPDNQPGSIEAQFVDEDISADSRPILLFDLNGTLTSHTAAKRSSGKSLMRPGIHHLRRLQVRGNVIPLLQSSKTLLHSTCHACGMHIATLIHAPSSMTRHDTFIVFLYTALVLLQ